MALTLPCWKSAAVCNAPHNRRRKWLNLIFFKCPMTAAQSTSVYRVGNILGMSMFAFATSMWSIRPLTFGMGIVCTNCKGVAFWAFASAGKTSKPISKQYVFIFTSLNVI